MDSLNTNTAPLVQSNRYKEGKPELTWNVSRLIVDSVKTYGVNNKIIWRLCILKHVLKEFLGPSGNHERETMAVVVRAGTSSYPSSLHENEDAFIGLEFRVRREWAKFTRLPVNISHSPIQWFARKYLRTYTHSRRGLTLSGLKNVSGTPLERI